MTIIMLATVALAGYAGYKFQRGTTAVEHETAWETHNRSQARQAAARASDWISQQLPAAFREQAAAGCGGGRRDLWAFNSPGFYSPACDASILGGSEIWARQLEEAAANAIPNRLGNGDPLDVGVSIRPIARTIDGEQDSYTFHWQVNTKTLFGQGYAEGSAVVTRPVPAWYPAVYGKPESWTADEPRAAAVKF